MAKRGLDYLRSPEKRQLDVVGGVTIASALIPFAVGVAAVTSANSKSFNPLFKQSRSGGNQKELFTTYKFRTLPKDVDPQQPYQSFGAFDPRANSIGAFIRQSGLDEIPQIINVFKGEMSLVGPRPLPIPDIEKNQAADPILFDEWYAYFNAIRPGLTGKSQVHRHQFMYEDAQILRDSMRMDIEYCETATLQQDMKWLAKTPLEMMLANVHPIEARQ